MKKSIIAACLVISALCGGIQIARADSGGSVSPEKLEKIIEKQDLILQRLEEIKAELEIIKVRATLR